jgi:hypothetical protein
MNTIIAIEQNEASTNQFDQSEIVPLTAEMLSIVGGGEGMVSIG